jgi:hypothetical protein
MNQTAKENPVEPCSDFPVLYMQVKNSFWLGDHTIHISRMSTNFN